MSLLVTDWWTCEIVKPESAEIGQLGSGLGGQRMGVTELRFRELDSTTQSIFMVSKIGPLDEARIIWLRREIWESRTQV